MPSPVRDATREEVLGFFCQDTPTDPARLQWEPLFGLMKNTLRLRMNIVEANISEELIAAVIAFRYPAEDPPEVRGLVRVLDTACAALGIRYRLEAGPTEPQGAAVAAFEPYKLRLPFVRATLSLYIAPGEFQWVLRNAGKEPPPGAETLKRFEQVLLAGTQQWLQNGNR